jgi:hypothetical protein
MGAFASVYINATPVPVVIITHYDSNMVCVYRLQAS